MHFSEAHSLSKHNDWGTSALVQFNSFPEDLEVPWERRREESMVKAGPYAERQAPEQGVSQDFPDTRQP